MISLHGKVMSENGKECLIDIWYSSGRLTIFLMIWESRRFSYA